MSRADMAFGSAAAQFLRRGERSGKIADPPLVRMMTRAQVGVNAQAENQLAQCAAGGCAEGDVHHPRCKRVNPPPVTPSTVQVRCGCDVTQHCRNTGLPCAGQPCFIQLEDIALLDLAHEIARTRFLATRQEEHRTKKRSKGDEDEG